MIRFHTEWIEAPGVRDPALAATFARIRLQVGDSCLTRAADLGAQSIRDGVFASALPLAEWMVDRYYFVCEEERAPEGRDTLDPVAAARLSGRGDVDGQLPIRAWRSRHALRAGRDGMAVPEVVFWRQGEAMAIGWAEDQSLLPGTSLRFLERGCARLENKEFLQGIHAFINAVAERVQHLKGDPRVDAFLGGWDQILKERPSERRIKALVARLGLEGDDVAEDVSRAVARLASVDPRSLLGQLPDCVDPSRLPRALDWAGQVESGALANGGAPDKLMKVREAARAERGHRDAPWLTGWSRASALRRIVGWEEDRVPVSLEEGLADALGWDANGHTFVIPSPDRHIDSVSAWPAGHGPSLVYGRTFRTPAKRFRIARAIHDFVFESDAGQPYYKIASDHLPHRVSVANAFAAELLAPVERLKRTLPADSAVTDEDVDEIAATLEVGSFVVSHQLENHGLARRVRRSL